MSDQRLQRTRDAYGDTLVDPHAPSCVCAADWPEVPCPVDCEYCTCGAAARHEIARFEDEGNPHG